MESHDFLTGWEQKRLKVKGEYPDMTDDELAYEVGKEEQLLKNLEKKTGKTRDEIRNWLHLMG